MKIAIIAQEAKRELAIRFGIAYYGILNKHDLYSSNGTGKYIAESTGLNINTFLGYEQSVCEQISSRVSCGEIDMVIFFKDANRPDLSGLAENNLLRLCDLYTVPYATNLATAEVLIHGLERGDLDWIKVGRPSI